MDGFIVKVTKPDRLSPGGKYTITWIIIAGSAAAALAKVPMEGATITEQGPDVLKRARQLGLENGGMRRIDL